MANIDFKTGYAKYMNKKYTVNVYSNTNNYKLPSKGIKSFAKGKSSTTSSKSSKLSIYNLTKILENKYKFITNPLKKVDKYTKEFWNAVFTSNNIQRVNNSFKALIIQSINKKSYGSNKKSTIKAKGFDRKLINTGQTIKNIKVKLENKDK